MKNKINRKVLGIILLLGFVFLFAAPVFATDTGIVPCGHDKACTLCDLIAGFKKLFDYGIKIIAVITLACATFAGVMYIVSSGNESMMESAKNFLKASLIGLAVVLGAWVIVNTVITVLMPTQEGMGIGKKWSEFGNINCSSSAPPLITTTSLSDGKVDVAYTATLSASGGDGTYTWLVTGLPAGLSQTNNIISGIPTADGTFKVNIKLTSGTQNVSKQLNLIINAKSKCELLAGSKSASFVFMLVRSQRPDSGLVLGKDFKKWDNNNQDQFNEFKTITNQMAKGLDEVKSEDRNYFAIYRMDEIDNGDNSSKITDIIQKNCPEAAKNKFFSWGYIYNSDSSDRAFARISTSNAYYFSGILYQDKVFVHEQLGHSFAKFRDEYDDESNGTISDFLSLSSLPYYSLPWANVTQDNKCAKWKSLTAGCFQGCNYSKTRCYRSSDNSIMRNHWDGIFNTVQDYIINACVKVFSNCPPKSLKETVIF